jgi:cytochrome c-type biogenesis protein CcmE
MTRRGKRFALLAGALAVAAAAAGLILAALGRSVAYFYTPSDLAALDAAPSGVVRLGGLVAAGSVHFADQNAEVVFEVADAGAARAVVYRGVLPDLFREGQGVVVEGRLGADGRLVAGQVLAKHDETYMPREVAEALKKQGLWKDGATTPAP